MPAVAIHPNENMVAPGDLNVMRCIALAQINRRIAGAFSFCDRLVVAATIRGISMLTARGVNAARASGADAQRGPPRSAGLRPASGGNTRCRRG